MKIKNPETVSVCSIHQKIKYGNQRTATWGLFSDYCKHSSIHGVQYLGEQKRSLPERLFWILIFAFSIYGCLSLIGNTWEKWQRNPVIVSFNEIPTPVSNIPFPAVTICPEFKFLQDKYNFTNVIMKLFTNLTENSQLTEEERIYTDAMGHICEYDTLIETFEKFNNNTENIFEDENKFTNLSTIISTFEELNPYMNHMFSGCYFQSKLIPCKHLFKKIITKEGICFSFNQLDFEYMYRNETVIKENYLKNGTSEWISHIKKPNDELNWNIEHGYSKNSNKYSYPRRSLWSGTKAGLFLWLNGYKCKWDKFCRGPILGYKILLAAPDEIDDVSSQYIQIPLGQQILVSMKPKVLYTSKQLLNYKPQARQCFFQNERYLKYFKYYNQKNCYFECLTNFTLAECGCVRFDMPLRNDTPVCGLGNLQCYNNAESNLINQELETGCQQQKDHNFKNFLKSTCNCLPACTSIAYETEITQAPYNVTNHYEAFISTFQEDYIDVSDMTRLFIFFKEQQFLTSKRSELYGLTEFLANCGGLLGLFMGVSTLSLIEFIYFCTIRLCMNLNMRRKAKNGKNQNIANNN